MKNLPVKKLKSFPFAFARARSIALRVIFIRREVLRNLRRGYGRQRRFAAHAAVGHGTGGRRIFRVSAVIPGDVGERAALLESAPAGRRVTRDRGARREVDGGGEEEGQVDGGEVDGARRARARRRW